QRDDLGVPGHAPPGDPAGPDLQPVGPADLPLARRDLLAGHPVDRRAHRGRRAGGERPGALRRGRRPVRVRRLDVFTASLHLDGGFAHFAGRVTALEQVYARLTGEDGLCGWGEVRGNMGYFSGESPAGIVATLREVLAPLVVGRTLGERGAVLEACDRAVVGNHAAKAVLDIAWHDLAARAAGVPLVRWLGGRRGAELLGSECVFYGPPERAAADARRYAAEGFRIVKVRVGLEPFSRDVARVAAVREAVGDDVRLAVDANQAWSPKEAIRRIRALQAFGIESVEQPVS